MIKSINYNIPVELNPIGTQYRRDVNDIYKHFTFGRNARVFGYLNFNTTKLTGKLQRNVLIVLKIFFF